MRTVSHLRRKIMTFNRSWLWRKMPSLIPGSGWIVDGDVIEQICVGLRSTPERSLTHFGKFSVLKGVAFGYYSWLDWYWVLVVVILLFLDRGIWRSEATKEEQDDYLGYIIRWNEQVEKYWSSDDWFWSSWLQLNETDVVSQCQWC